MMPNCGALCSGIFKQPAKLLKSSIYATQSSLTMINTNIGILEMQCYTLSFARFLAAFRTASELGC
jgi:hypothetical protein